jgi:hypothetical protein
MYIRICKVTVCYRKEESLDLDMYKMNVNPKYWWIVPIFVWFLYMSITFFKGTDGWERYESDQHACTLHSTYCIWNSVVRCNMHAHCIVHHKKKVGKFTVSSRDVTTKLSLGGNYDVITELFLPRGSLVSDIPAGDGKLVNLFSRCTYCTVFEIQYYVVAVVRKRILLIILRILHISYSKTQSVDV